MKKALITGITGQDGSYLAEFLVYETAQKLGFKVMLGGQGGDEVFMGYRKYQFYSFF